ncbi:hypothetical protein KQX54_005326 [Cotesia glomerata]|uniref:Peptidase S1 domain-containing protein n=1 Tax=Cotesia glomerata TaxID=32391 RepID=A0AAV7I1M6_COTGL|nr:hypothetical protein KQX54_005326 [Cotesia glomerata]
MIPMVTIQTCDLNIYIVTETSLHSLHSLMNSTWPKLGIAMIRIFGTFSSDGPCYVEHLSVSRYWQTPSSEKEFSIASWEQNVVGNKITFDSKTSRWSPQKTQDCYQYYPLNSDLLHSENIFCAVLNENNLKNSSCILGDLGSPVVSYSYLTGIKSQKMDLSSIRADSTQDSINIDEDQNSRLNETPWLVSIRINGVHYCSGAIVSNSWVITSSQCIFNIQEMIPMVTIQTCDLNLYTLTETSVHSLPNLMNSVWPKSGIAMIKIFGTFRSDRSCSIKHLQIGGSYAISSGEEFSIASWEQNVVGNKIRSNSKTSRWLSLKPQDCLQYYSLNSDLVNSQNIFCAILNNNNLKNSSCILGDLGSPIIEDNFSDYIIGIKSQKMDCKLFPHSRSLFTNVQSYENWIFSQINTE